MRITTRLSVTTIGTFGLLMILAPVLIWALSEFRSAKDDNVLANLLHDNFFERASFRDQYFLYREGRALSAWDASRAAADVLLRQARGQFRTQEEQRVVQQLQQAIENTTTIFHLIVSNTQAAHLPAGHRVEFEELDKRLYSQLLVEAAAVRDAATALQHSSEQRIEQAYVHLSLVAGFLSMAFALVIVLNAVQMGRLIRRRFMALHAGAQAIAGGNLAHRIDCDGLDEFAELAQSINGMTDRLQLLATRLEAQVLERTAELQLSESHLRAIIAAEPECIKIVDAQGCLTQMNPAGLAMIEAASLEQVAGLPVLDLLLPEHRQAFANMHQRVLDGESVRLEFELLGLKGRRRWMETHAAPLQMHGHRVQLAVTRDITERRQFEEKLQLAASVFTHAREGIMITSADAVIIDVNAAFTRITGYEREEVVGKNPRILKSDRQDEAFYAAMWRDLDAQHQWHGEVWNRRKNGEVYASMQTVSAVRDAHGKTLQYVSLFSDITAIKENQVRLEHMAHFDALTHLPNRLLLADRMHQGLIQAQRRGQMLAIVYLDLDGFKSINDRHGHEVGDQLLIAIAARMKLSLREGDTLARLGGDEFVAVLIDLEDAAASTPMLNRLLGAARQPVQVGELGLQVSASLGVTFYPQAQDMDADQLLRQADQAMYQAKLAGKNRYHVFDAEHDSNVRVHHESVERIRLALDRREFVLHYQPKVNMRSGNIIGAEALIRWQQPERGLLFPGQFLPVIEDHPLAVAIGEWVIDAALTQVERWRAEGLELAVSVNVGARQLQQGDFVQRLTAILAAHPQVMPSLLELEILETSALEDVGQVSRVIESCAQLGVTFALDDFGTGYSSLTYLKRLRVTTLKIDQSFVRDMLDDPDDLAILQGVIGLAAAFKRQVIAEGVETVEHGSLLLQLGCDLAQGYGIARPMPPEAMPAWAAGWQPEPDWDKLPWLGSDG